jgi:hypothetical protein
MKPKKQTSPWRELFWAVTLVIFLIISVLFTTNINDGVEVFGVPVYAPCAFYVVFHHPCPSCGLTRAMVAALHLDIFQSLRFNWAGIWVIIGWMALIGWRVQRFVLRRRTDLPAFEQNRDLWGRIGIIYTLIFAALIIGNWIYHLIT